MIPYYQDDLVVIYNCDCREILSFLPRVDLEASETLCLVDPPYGIGYVNGAVNIPNATKFAGVPIMGDDQPFDPAFLLNFPNLLLWGANHYAHQLPVSRWLVWDKRCGIIPERDTSDCEFAWARGTKGNCARIFRHFWDGFNKQSERGQPRSHPTQKPIALMKWCIEFYPNIDLILDPFMGSGTTLRAAKELGRKAIGIEIEERYCEIASKRCQEPIQESIFAQTIKPQITVQQEDLFAMAAQ